MREKDHRIATRGGREGGEVVVCRGETGIREGEEVVGCEANEGREEREEG